MHKKARDILDQELIADLLPVVQAVDDSSGCATRSVSAQTQGQFSRQGRPAWCGNWFQNSYASAVARPGRVAVTHCGRLI